ncbi:heme-binding protein soul4 [Menidia menidia]
MTGPIQEMTRNSHQRETLPYVLVSAHEKLQYEVRGYPAGFWAVVCEDQVLYEQSVSLSFMRLMRFICKENSAGRFLGLTVPVVSSVRLLEDGSFGKQVETAFFLPACYQSQPPQSPDPRVSVVHRDAFRVASRMFLGTTTEETVGQQIRQLWEVLDPGGSWTRDRYAVAVYDNPGGAPPPQ